MLTLLAVLAIPAVWATSGSVLDEPEYTDYGSSEVPVQYTDIDEKLIGMTLHNKNMPKEEAMTKFLDMTALFFGSDAAEPNNLDEGQMKVVDELFDAYDADNDNMWNEVEFSEYFVASTRMKKLWETLAGENNVVEKPAMKKYLGHVFTGSAANTISSLIAVSQGLALTAPNVEAFISEMADSFEYPLTWEAFKTYQVKAVWKNLSDPKHEGLADEETMLDFFFGPTKDIVKRMENVEISTAASDFDTVGELIEDVAHSGSGERRRVAEKITDATICMLGALGDMFWGPLSTLMSIIGCVDLLLNAPDQCGYSDAFIPGNGPLSCMAGFIPVVGMANNIKCIVDNVNAITALGKKNTPPSCRWFIERGHYWPDCGYHKCGYGASARYPQFHKRDKCGDGNQCQKGWKYHCCEKFERVKAPEAAAAPALRLYNKKGDSKPVCRDSCNLRSGTCYQCSNGVSCRSCSRFRGNVADCRTSYCIHQKEACSTWNKKHACVGRSLGDYNKSQSDCVKACLNNSKCNCVTWGVKSSKKCRLETGTFTTNRGNSRYSAVAMKDCSKG